MNKQLLFLFFLLSTISGIAGDKYTLKIDSILDRARKLRAVENVSYLKLSLEALDLANSHAYDKGIAEASFMAGDALINMGLYKQGFRHLLKVSGNRVF
ncbi:hypothetical protein ABTW24_14670 [Sphingobacterium thalpophilum]|uniref:Uncharacterized protein n=1 Tax=Sphingobacterium thalpophilum TaxID=259 RepID=A0ABV4HFQ5_9SPHI